jgi:hypothetical protein
MLLDMQELGCFIHTILTQSTLGVAVNYSMAFLHTAAYVLTKSALAL